jgi:hypothetical protein
MAWVGSEPSKDDLKGIAELDQDDPGLAMLDGDYPEFGEAGVTESEAW